MSSEAGGPTSAATRDSGLPVQADNVEHLSILAGSPDAIWCWLSDGTITEWNPTAERLFGYAAREIVGRSLLELVPGPKRAAAEDVIRRVSSGTSLPSSKRSELAATASPSRSS